MVAGHLQEKNDFYYIVLSYKDANGKRKTKWEATGLSVKRNKKKAEALLMERRRNFTVSTAPAPSFSPRPSGRKGPMTDALIAAPSRPAQRRPSGGSTNLVSAP